MINGETVNKAYQHKTSTKWGQMIHWGFISAMAFGFKDCFEDSSKANWKKVF